LDVVDDDPLGDTPTCDNFDSCLDIPNLFTNLMFPRPLISPGGGRVPQRSLTGQQSAVLNRNILVD